ncbi:Uncharacterized protein DAT39_003433, partial [Clarias magur]
HAPLYCTATVSVSTHIAFVSKNSPASPTSGFLQCIEDRQGGGQAYSRVRPNSATVYELDGVGLSGRIMVVTEWIDGRMETLEQKTAFRLVLLGWYSINT